MDDSQIRNDIQRLNIQGYEERWECSKSPCLKPRAKSEYSYLDKIHCVPTLWSVDQQAAECHDSGVSLPLAISQASNLQYNGQRMIDRSFGFLDKEQYNIRPHIFNCRSEPSIPPRLSIDALSQVRPGYLEQNTRPASIHISSYYNDSMYTDNVLYNEHEMMYHSIESMYHSKPTNAEHSIPEREPMSVSDEQDVVIDKDPKRGFGFTIRTATNIFIRDRVKIKEVKPDSPAAVKGLLEGQVLLHVNGKDIQQLTFEDIVDLIHNEGNQVKLTVVSNSVSRPNDTIQEGYLQRQIKCGGIKIWCKQWVIVKRDGCLYYYRSRESQDPSGMIVLPAFRYSKAVQANRKHVIRITRGSCVYLFAAQDSADYEKWLQVLAEANKTQTYSIHNSIHNCGLAALAIDNPLMTGWLYKLKLSGFRAKRKYCVMKDNVLLFYHNIYDKKAHEVICLAGYTCAPTSVRNWKHCFALIPPTMKRCNSVMVFANDSKVAYDRWCQQIMGVLDTLKAGNDVRTSSPAPAAASPALQHQPLQRKDSGEPCESKEYYRKKEIKNGSMYNFNTLVHTGDTDEMRPRSWHVQEQ